jgi:hypothetical protein
VTHYWRIKRWRPDRYGQPCRIIAAGRGNVLVQFADGELVVSVRWSVRKLRT